MKVKTWQLAIFFKNLFLWQYTPHDVHERLFDFKYRIEIYVPAAQRRWGYYVLPFRIGDRIVARVDLKADRPAKTLQVKALHHEAGADIEATESALESELGLLADWLGLEDVRYL